MTIIRVAGRRLQVACKKKLYDKDIVDIAGWKRKLKSYEEI
jgi:hypothetical protein